MQVFQKQAKYRSNRADLFCEKDTFKDLAKFTGKYPVLE